MQSVRYKQINLSIHWVWPAKTIKIQNRFQTPEEVGGGGTSYLHFGTLSLPFPCNNLTYIKTFITEIKASILMVIN